MRALLPPVQHQPAPILRNRADALAHPAEDAFDAGRPEVRDRNYVTAAVTHFSGRASR